MTDPQSFGLAVAGAAAAGLGAVLLNRLSERVRVPAPALVLVAAAVAAHLVPGLGGSDPATVERVVSLALVAILFDGGLHIGYRRFCAVAAPVALLGVVGTFVTTAGVAAFAHVALGFGWYVAVLLGAAVAPTDPAVVFAVLGRREIAGPAGTVLEGESGANDPVGIALMTALIAAGGLSGGALAGAAREFGVQMAVGLVGGLAGARMLAWASRSVALPNEALHPLRALAGAYAVFGLTAAAGGSGFLAVFVAGIALGDGPAPYQRETERFTAALAGLGEIVAFVALGLTVDLDVLARADVWGPGLLLAAVLAVAVRPALVGLCMQPLSLPGRERAFVLWAGLKGAVPILLGSLLLGAGLPDADRLYGIVVVVVVASVVVQGGSVALAARLLRIPMRSVDPLPYAVGVRLREPDALAHDVTVRSGARAAGSALADLPGIGETLWVSLLVRDGRLHHLTPATRLAAGDRLVVLASPASAEDTVALFTLPGPTPPRT